jgi:hypothetical protein
MRDGSLPAGNCYDYETAIYSIVYQIRDGSLLCTYFLSTWGGSFHSNRHQEQVTCVDDTADDGP